MTPMTPGQTAGVKSTLELELPAAATTVTPAAMTAEYTSASAVVHSPGAPRLRLMMSAVRDGADSSQHMSSVIAGCAAQVSEIRVEVDHVVAVDELRFEIRMIAKGARVDHCDGDVGGAS